MALVYAAAVFGPRSFLSFLSVAGAVSPGRFLAGPEANGGVLGMIAPLFSHLLVHANLPHLFFNSVWLLALGAPVARRMGADSADQSFAAFARAMLFLTFFGLSGAAGALTFIALHMEQFTSLVGASGAVSGLLGAVVRFAFNRSTMFGPEYAKIGGLFTRPVLMASIVIIGMNIAVGIFGAAIPGGGDNIAWDAHIGGYLFGLVFYPAFERLARFIR
ncbi:MAG: rhomboid family intramembrane serine protease [Pseudomonadota bacterium]